MVAIKSLRIDNRSQTRIMGILNVSPESFYKGSIRASGNDIKIAATSMQASGADLIDIGGMSTAPYLRTYISTKEETRRVVEAVTLVRNCCTLPISVDTPRAEVAKAAIERGASLINDITGLKFDKKMATLISDHGVAVIVGAYMKARTTGGLASTLKALRESLEIAENAGIAENKIIVDPCIGFFRREATNSFSTRVTSVSWYTRDQQIIRNFSKLHSLSKPISVGVSNKSFLGEIFKLKVGERLVPSLISEVKCSLSGANILRTHHVKETSLALKACRLFGISRSKF